MTTDRPLCGRCSRCGQPALLTEDRWTHPGDRCPDADFLPNPPQDPRMQPTIGRIVHYTLTEADAKAINTRRSDFTAFGKTHVHPHRPGQPGATGHVAHVGNHATAGDVYPALIVRVWDETKVSVNLQVHLDGNDTYWATSRFEGDGEGHWTWPNRTPAPEEQPPVTKPLLGDRVHYVAHGTPMRADGTQAYPAKCRAATVTDTNPDGTLALSVFNPDGIFLKGSVMGDPTERMGGTWHQPDATCE